MKSRVRVRLGQPMKIADYASQRYLLNKLIKNLESILYIVQKNFVEGQNRKQ